MSGRGERAFEVSLDGSLTRSFDDIEFIVSLPIIRGKGKFELAEFLPKRGEGSSTSSSENDEKCTEGGKGECLKGCRYKGKSSEGEEDSDSSEESQEHPSPLRKLAWAWERRALRAEASLKRYQDGRSHGENGRSKA